MCIGRCFLNGPSQELYTPLFSYDIIACFLNEPSHELRTPLFSYDIIGNASLLVHIGGGGVCMEPLDILLIYLIASVDIFKHVHFITSILRVCLSVGISYFLGYMLQLLYKLGIL